MTEGPVAMVQNEDVHGASFRRADLHIHSYGENGSYDVKDVTMTPEAIVDTAISDNLEIIAITDHNSIGNVQAAIKHAQGKPLLVIPGVELSTSQGHLLVYFRDVSSLNRFYGSLKVSDDFRACEHSISQCLEIAAKFDGIGIAAHIDLDTGFELMCVREDRFKDQVLQCKNLLGLEITKPETNSWYTDQDQEATRKHRFHQRRNMLGQDESYAIAKLMSSDAHSLGMLGKNARSARKLTRIKMSSLTFDAFKIALLDPVARIRIEDLIPETVPRFTRMTLSGGFLDGITVQFSPNLNCIIGGRGTGKSTMLECLRATSGNRAADHLVDCEVWPESVALSYRDSAGQDISFSRRKGGEVRNVTIPDGMLRVPVESYGQGETAETIQHCGRKPSVLLDFLDQFIDLAELKTKDEELRQKLLDNQTEIESLELELKALPDVKAAKVTAQNQIATLKQQDAKAVVELEVKLNKGRAIRKELIEGLSRHFKIRSDAFATESIGEMVGEFDATDLAVGQEEFDAVKLLVDAFDGKMAAIADEFKRESNATKASLKIELAKWKDIEAKTEKKIEDLRKELLEKGIRLDMDFIRKVTQDVGRHEAKEKLLLASREKLVKAKADRQALVKQRRENKQKLCKERERLGASINKSLKSTVIDYSIVVAFDEGRLSEQSEAILKDAMGYRTAQVPKASVLAATFSPFEILDIVDKNDVAKLLALTDQSGGKIFGNDDATKLISKLREFEVRAQLERCEFEDTPHITVTKITLRDSAPPIVRKHSFDKLSLGQQQSVLLSIMLFSPSINPLIIDQPEDNLDSEFIFKTFVSTLRTVKEKRQVIVVTHNANIAVLGDAELIIPLRATSDRSIVRDSGSIDNELTKALACTILEGSEQAFKKRQSIYGLPALS